MNKLFNKESIELFYKDNFVKLFKSSKGYYFKENLVSVASLPESTLSNTSRDLRLKHLHSILLEKNVNFLNKSVIDFGGGRGNLYNFLKNSVSSYINIENDITLESYLISKKIPFKPKLNKSILANCDIIICSHSLIYSDSIDLLKMIFKLIKKDALIIIENANINSFYYRSTLFLNKLFKLSLRPFPPNNIIYYFDSELFFKSILGNKIKVKKFEGTNNASFYSYSPIKKAIYLVINFLFNKVISKNKYIHNNLFILKKSNLEK